jgi:hypothetical protein
MRLLLVGGLATLTAAGLAAIRPALVTPEESAAALAVRDSRLRADERFLSSDLLAGLPGSRGDAIARAFVASRFEALGLDSEGAGAAAVAGRLAGRDPALRDEAVLITARLGGPGIPCLLAVAEAFAALPSPPRRSILFAALRTEEAGVPVVPGLALRLDLDAEAPRSAEQARQVFLVGARVADAPPGAPTRGPEGRSR